MDKNIVDCFAADGRECKILDIKRCNPKNCGFKKTRKQFDQQREDALWKLGRLDWTKIAHISKKYYRGRLPSIFRKAGFHVTCRPQKLRCKE